MNFHTLDLNLLRVFDKLMSEGSLTRAAAALSMTQPAASHALKRLHDAVGEALFVRTAFGMKPTPRAEEVWPQVRGALASLQKALAPDSFDPQTDETSFRVAMADATASTLAPPLVAAIETARALVNLRLMPITRRDPRPMLDQGEVDLAVGHFHDSITAIVASGEYATHRYTRLLDTHYVCVMRRGHPLARATLDLESYCDAHHMLVSITGRPFGLADHTLSALGLKRRVVLTVNQFYTAGCVLLRSDLLSVLPERFIPATGVANQLVMRELPFDLGRVPVDMVWHLRKDLDPPHRWLRALVQQAAETSLPPG